MKKKQCMLGMCFILLAIITGCGGSSIKQGTEQGKEILHGAEGVSKEEPLYNTAFEKYAEDEVIALIINEPGQEVVEGITRLETYTHYENSGKLLLIPKYNGTQIEVKKVIFDGEKLVEGETLYTKSYTGDDYGLLVETFRPEGIPEVLVSVRIGDRQATYIIAENGKDGIPERVYLTQDGENKTQSERESQEVDEQVQIIYPMEEGEDMQGYNLVNVNEMDIDDDEQMEKIEVYCTAALNEDGELRMDDGNGWRLIVHKDGKLYPVVDSSIQLGKLEYKSYMEYGETNVFHLLISKAGGAGLTMYDCYYDEKQDAFVSKVVYQTTGNIGFNGIKY